MSQVVRKITLAVVKDLKAGEEVRDSDLKGFGARCQAKAVTYFVLTRIRGRLKRLTIGRHGSPWTPETARKEASRLLLSIRTGQDPAKERDERRQLSERFEAVAESFLELHGTKLKVRTREEYARIIRRQLGPRFNGKPLADLSASDVARAHASWQKTPRAANHALAVLSKILNWASQQGCRCPSGDVCSGVQRYRENERERYLSDEELARLGAALVDAEKSQNPVIVAVIHMLILTGARLSEMLTLRWEYVDLDRQVLRLPDSKTGAKTIVLNAAAVDVLSRLHRLEGNPWVFPGHRHGSHLVNLQKPWREIRAAAGLDDVRLHDLRHSFASIAVGVGGSLPLIGHLLGHTQAQTTARYAHVASSPAKHLADAAGARIASAMRLNPEPNDISVTSPSPFRRVAGTQKSETD